MNFYNIASTIGSAGSVSALQPSIWDVIISIVNDRFQISAILNIVANLIYTLFTWIMSMIDFMFILIRELCGLNTDFSSLESVEKSDIIFRFIFSDQIREIMKYLFWFAVVVILVLGIIAIIKNEYDAVIDKSSTGEIKNDKSGIWKSIFQSLLLLILVPMILFGGLILSNGLLQTIYNYTAGGANNKSIGTQIFMASSYNANALRSYALNNKKIPITYQFSALGDTSFVYVDESDPASELEQTITDYKNAPEWVQGLTTFWLFYTDTFYEMSQIDRVEYRAPNNNYYQLAYDRNINTYSYEYLANADAIDYMFENSEELYYMTLKEVYDSMQNASDELLDLGIIGGEGLDLMYKYTQPVTPDSTGQVTYEISVGYNDSAERRYYSYKVIDGQDLYDESDGAIFLLCKSVTRRVGNETVQYFKPLVNGKDHFHTDYLKDGELVVAKGLFEDAKYPTAIRKQSGKIEFYRHVVNVPTFSSFFPKISYELPDGVTENPVTGLIRKGIQFFTGVDIADFVPYVYFDIDLLHLFQKTTKTIYKLDDSKIIQDYTFSKTSAQAILNILDTTKANMHLTYSTANLNWIVLIFATFIIFSKLFKAMIGLLRRIVDIMFLYIMYPAAVATIPYYGKNNFQNWTKEMITRIVAMYGFIVGINLGLLLLYPISEITLITSDMFSQSGLSWLNWNIGLFGLPLYSTVNALNHLIRLLFYLVGVWFIFEIPKVVQEFVYKGSDSSEKNGEKDSSYNGDLVSMGGQVTEETKKVFTKVAEVVSGQALLNKLKEASGFVPGMAIVNDIKQKKKEADTKKLMGAKHMNFQQLYQKNVNAMNDKKKTQQEKVEGTQSATDLSKTNGAKTQMRNTPPPKPGK